MMHGHTYIKFFMDVCCFSIKYIAGLVDRWQSYAVTPVSVFHVLNICCFSGSDLVTVLTCAELICVCVATTIVINFAFSVCRLNE